MLKRSTFQSVFLTVGTTRFDKLVEAAVARPVVQALKAIGCRKLTIQAGSSATPFLEDFHRDALNIEIYSYKDSIYEDIKAADLVIGHAGAGTVLEVLRQEKPLIVVINDSLMNNHQEELASQLQEDGHSLFCYPEALKETLEAIRSFQFRIFPKARPTVFSDYIDSFVISS